MILNELILHNFGVYKGRHILPLAPLEPSKPVILIGALNGSGKTTILDALQIALYGRFSAPARRHEDSYDSYLRSMVHNDVDPQEGASIELQFTQQENGTATSYRLIRAWSVKTDKLRENFEILRQGERDRPLAEAWPERVQDILPPRMANFFFFDGEKIEELADLKRAPQFIKEAVRALLGLDIVDQLTADLSILERRKRVSLAPTEDQALLNEHEQRLSALEQRREQAQIDMQVAEDSLRNAQNHLQSSESALQQAGGDLYKQRNAIREQRFSLEKDCQSTMADLRALAATPLPLNLVQELLKRTLVNAKQEDEYRTELAHYEAAKARDRYVEQLLLSDVPDKELAHTLIAKLQQSLREMLPSESLPSHLNIDRTTILHLHQLLEKDLPGLDLRAVELQNRATQLSSELTLVDRRLASVPDSEAIEALIVNIDVAHQNIGKCGERIEQCRGVLSEVDSQIAMVQRSLGKLVHGRVEEHNRNLDAERVIQFSGLARDVLGRFSSAVIKHHLSRIEILIEKALQDLYRKKGTVTRIVIDPVSFDMTLNNVSRVVSADLLSAGERQLLATGLLWALAQAAGRPMPTVIDTPLGRLDSEHRKNLVKSYFPNASHQVILLSTDEEIAGSYYEALKPAVSRTFTLLYDEVTRSSRIEDGYAFVRRASHVH
jgi:DNA sulfur modification protein DndD